MADGDALLFDGLPAGLPTPREGYASAPVGRRRSSPQRRRRMRPHRPSTAALLAQLADRLDRQHRETVAALDRLAHLGRAEREALPVVLRQITEIRRALGLTELHRPERHTRRRPTGAGRDRGGA